MRCGARLTVGPGEQATTSSTSVTTVTSLEEAVKMTVVKRLDGIKNRDGETIRSQVDTEKYTKFDDWSPFRRQRAEEALKNEADALKVLTSYDYEVKDFKVDVMDGTALATFQLHYKGHIRNKHFDVEARVTTLLKGQGLEWKIVHEHYSRFPGY